MGEKSRSKKSPEVKDPLRWRKANIARFDNEVRQLAAAYHRSLARLKDETSALEVASAALAANGHPLYTQQAAPEAPAGLDAMLLPVAPEVTETATAPEAAASGDPSP